MNRFFMGKKAIVTGAGKGFGRGIAERLSELSARVIAISRTPADLDSLKSEYPNIDTVLLDIGDWNTTRQAVQTIGPVDMLVNNAGVFEEIQPFLDVTRENLQNLHAINFHAAFNIAQVVAQGMVSRKICGSIVNVSSVGGKAPRSHVSYDTSKAALDMLTMSMAKELGPYQIRTNSVNPGLVVTNMTRECLKHVFEEEGRKIPLGHLAEVKDVVDTVVFLLSDNASMINGQRVGVDGGVGMVPN